MRYCEGAKTSLLVRLLARLLGLGRASLSMNDQKWRISLKLYIVSCANKVYSTVTEFKVGLWNRLSIANYFPALMLPKA